MSATAPSKNLNPFTKSVTALKSKSSTGRMTGCKSSIPRNGSAGSAAIRCSSLSRPPRPKKNLRYDRRPPDSTRPGSLWICNPQTDEPFRRAGNLRAVAHDKLRRHVCQRHRVRETGNPGLEVAGNFHHIGDVGSLGCAVDG